MRKPKIDRALDWLTDNSEENCHLSFVNFVAPPRKRSQVEILDWLTTKIDVTSQELGLTEPPFRIYVSDWIRWRDSNQFVFVGQSAVTLQQAQGLWIGIDPYIAMVSVLGQISELAQVYYKKLKESEEPNHKEVLVLEKLSARAALTAEAIANLEVRRDKQEVGMGYAYQLATDVKSLANQDPNATPKMREWIMELLSAGLKQLEERS